ncbi:uncharacterized protein RAG0_01603 [Rhynchosporium agropyri]|uniref:RRM domain-containing protein n=1 Tax=Rhynchosporium agropyri TaxID=914238 RepID=A0A1E1JXN0_9HELO|nr:uncharacterized protein RAG0_01603 [Rhynchosporium agropyri]
MAKDTQTKKRKASVSEVEAEKVKKVENVVAPPSTEAAPAKKRKATEDAAPVKVKKTKIPKDVAEVKTSSAPKKASKTTTSAATTPKDAGKSEMELSTAVKKPIAPKSKTSSAASKKEKVAKAPKPEIKVDEEIDSGLEDEDKEMDEDSESELDENAVDILKGFESDGDDEDIADGLPEGAEVPLRKQLSKSQEKKLKKIKEAAVVSDKPGVVYVGRIPHGFYENEMKAYFKQFGNILKLRLSRNKKSGASKHFAWIQFESADVADIVAKTMDNYMMFSHLLKVKLIPDDQVNPDWFKGANKRFKRVPWNKMEGRKLEQPKSEGDWNAKNDLESKKREKKAAKLKEIGYEFTAPKLKSATGVAKPKAPEQLANGESEVKPVNDTPATEKVTKSKKQGKKGKNIEPPAAKDLVSQADNKAKNASVTLPPSKEDVEESIDALIEEVAVKPKKGKKAKTVKEVEVVEAVEKTAAVIEEAKPVKEKKVKKTKVVETSEDPITETTVPAPEKKLKTKKSKTSLVETVTPVVAPEEAVAVAKAKNSKKRKASS